MGKKIDNLKQKIFLVEGNLYSAFSHVFVFSSGRPRQSQSALPTRVDVCATPPSRFPAGELWRRFVHFLSLLLLPLAFYIQSSLTQSVSLLLKMKIFCSPHRNEATWMGKRFNIFRRLFRDFRIASKKKKRKSFPGWWKLMIYWPKDQTNLLMTQGEGKESSVTKFHSISEIKMLNDFLFARSTPTRQCWREAWKERKRSEQMAEW